jgi:hypothetical protein
MRAAVGLRSQSIRDNLLSAIEVCRKFALSFAGFVFGAFLICSCRT